MATSTAGDRRRELREELNRSLVLEAAEEAFAEHGYRGASIRDIAVRAGFSPAAIYLFFENKEALYGEMLVRRGTEVRDAMREASEGDGSPLTRLHRMADVAIDLYRLRPHFARLVAHGHAAMLGSPLGEWEQHPDERVRSGFERAMEVEAAVVREGQEQGEIRAGEPRAAGAPVLGAGEQLPGGRRRRRGRRPDRRPVACRHRRRAPRTGAPAPARPLDPSADRRVSRR